MGDSLNLSTLEHSRTHPTESQETSSSLIRRQSTSRTLPTTDRLLMSSSGLMESSSPTSPEPTWSPKSASRDSSLARTLSFCCQKTNPPSLTSADSRFGAEPSEYHLDILTWQIN